MLEVFACIILFPFVVATLIGTVAIGIGIFEYVKERKNSSKVSEKI